MKKVIYSAVFSLFLSSSAFAQSTQDAIQNSQQMKNPSVFEAMLQMLPLCIIIYFIFYFFVTRPQDQVNKKRLEMLNTLKSGNNVRTSCGIYGRVVSIEEKFVTLEISQGVKVKFNKDAIVEIV